eukprot:TRINITY_DN42536_c0_g1_i1.p1 TRINITY_DN42536_c0_g1~~TRINITY_DN42536_c0_g1_i1.p1  ORF type:complete len:338 (-),score=66.13 TRINITY_DN42536_c0_g1_i1:103-1116(-)
MAAMALNGTQSSMGGPPSGYEPQDMGGGGGRGGGGFGGGGGGGAGSGSMAAVSQLFTRLAQEIEEQRPKNCIHFVVDFLCKHYPEHLHGFASIWQMDPDLERERHEVVNFFKAHKISTAVAAHFTNAGYDTLDTLTTLSPDALVDVEAFNNVKWLPGHKVRLQQIFGEISARVRAYRQQYGEGAHHPRKHHSHHHHHSHHRVERKMSESPPPHHRVAHAAHHTAHVSSPQASYMPHAPLAIASHAAPVTHHVTTAAHTTAPPVVQYATAAAPPAVGAAVGAEARYAAYSGGFSGGFSGGLAPPPVAQQPPMGGLSLSPGINPTNNIFLNNSSLLPPS